MIENHHLYRLINEELFRVEEKVHRSENSTLKPLISVAVLSSQLNQNELDNLKRTLTALKINFENVKLLNSIDQMDFQPERLIVFGDEFKDSLQVQELYKPTNTKYGDVFISKPLSNLSEDQNEKVKFWEGLKKWFDV